MRFSRTFRLVLGLICAFVVMLSASGCTELFGSGTQPQNPLTKAQSQLVGISYDKYLCQKFGNQYTGRCYQRVNGVVYYMYNYRDFVANGYSYVGLRPVWQQDFSNPAYVTVLFINGDQLWHRTNISTGANEVYYNGQWLAQNLYESQMQQANQQRVEEGQRRYWDLMNEISESKHRSTMRWLEPACNSSYNGCR